MNLIDIFDQAASRHAARVAFVQPDGRTITYGEAAALSDIIASSLLEHRLPSDAKIAIFSPNDARAFLVMLGAMRAGLTWVPLNTRNAVDDNAAFVRTTDVALMFFHCSLETDARRIQALVPSLAHLVCLDQVVETGVAHEAVANRTRNVPQLSYDPQRPVNIIATGGTTGQSKGAVWTNSTWDALIANFWTSVPDVPHPVHLCVAPMTHAAGVLALMLLPKAATNIVLTKADPAAILEAIELQAVTHLYLPPTVLYSLLACPELGKRDTSSLRFFLISAAPVASDKLREAVAAFGPVICQAYGQAEAPFFLTFLSPDDHRRAVLNAEDAHLLQSCGRATIFSLVEIMSDDGRLLPPRAVGEVVARGNLVTDGYYNDAAATKSVSTHGWHHTGDVGFKDEDGYVYIVDRKKDMIITGGFNVFSIEVEKVLLSHPAIQDCAVIGVPDEKWGEAVTGVVELKPGQVTTSAELMQHCRMALGSVKTPKLIEIRDQLPRSPVGKILKRAIRDQYWAGRERAV